MICNDLLPCSVNRMRPSQRFDIPSGMTPFNDQQAIGTIVSGTALPNLLGHLLWASGAARIFQRTALEWFILTGQTNLGGSGSGEEYVAISDEQLSSRLSVLMTTLWRIAVAGKHIYEQEAVTNSTCLTTWSFVCSESGYWPAQADASVIRTFRIWRARREWIGVTITISILALMFGVLGLLLKMTASVPHILGYVSTMMRDNPYFDGPKGGERLDGTERARLLRSEDIRLTELSTPVHTSGHIALASDTRAGRYEAVVLEDVPHDERDSDRNSDRISDLSATLPRGEATRNDTDGLCISDIESNISAITPRDGPPTIPLRTMST